MRRSAFYCLFLGLAGGWSPAQPTPPAPAQPKATFDYNSPAGPQVQILHAAWVAEHDPARRSDLAGQLVEAVIHEYDKQQPEIVDEVARNGAPKNEISSPLPAREVKLDPLTVLAGVHSNPDDYPRSPIFRRMTANRLEAWTSKEGWLFDGKGKGVVDVKVPRRDGDGRDWFGAFLSNGTWITTDLWSSDNQLNCFSSTGQWKWELPGKKILAHLPKPKPNPDDSDEPIHPSIGWARADKTGRRWLVCLGLDYMRGFARIGPSGQVQPVNDQGSSWREWSEVYPRAMGVRGMYPALYIDSDDGKMSIHRNEAGHGVEVGWPRYDWSSDGMAIIPEGNDQFGFWSYSHDFYIEAEGDSIQEPHRVWFFGAEGKYQGEVTGSRLGDAANGHDLLVRDADNQVLQVKSGKTGLAIRDTRRFIWADGTTAVPLAIYDDLNLGFFLRGPGMQGFTDDARRARAGAEVVLAKW